MKPRIRRTKTLRIVVKCRDPKKSEALATRLKSAHRSNGLDFHRYRP